MADLLGRVERSVKQFCEKVKEMENDKCMRTAGNIAAAELKRKETGKEIRAARDGVGEQERQRYDTLCRSWSDAGKALTLVRKHRPKKAVSLQHHTTEDNNDCLSPTTLSSIGFRKYDLSSIDTDLAIAHEKSRELSDMEASINELHATYEDANLLVCEAAPKLAVASGHVTSASDKMKLGTEDVRKARKLKKRFFFF
eukprot:TRINITY_DN2597_c2_g1_i1.p1 TRINITY_DN2597_c2_g1~~TRINITY_DN2597_c2_g1_i1.p1  ORF type:complete len:198 (+),score=47.28 TRINITY_DN2597_c2_g1_i1:51-644(+)